MRQWINLFESNQNIVTAFRGSHQKHPPLHSKMFFSSCDDFASHYGDYITTYQLNVLNFLDSLDPDLIVQLFPLYDPYDDVEITNISEYMKRSSDTWEILEEIADDVCRKHGASGMIIYEGGVKNYIVFDTSVVKEISVTHLK